jgi:hypothetical protein
MPTDRDVTRIVRSWLQTDEYESADRVLDLVLAGVEVTRQRPTSWLARRYTAMNTYAKLAIAAAVVVVVVLVGSTFLPAGGGVGGDGPSPSPAPSVTAPPSPAPSLATPSASPSPAAFAWPKDTDLEVGTRYGWTVAGVPFTIAVPSPGWSTKDSAGQTLSKDSPQTPDGSSTGSWLLMWDVANVNTSPCATVAMDPPPGPSAADLAGAVASMPGLEVVVPATSVTVGGRPAQHQVVRLPDDLGCAPDKFELWYSLGHPSCNFDPGPCWRWASEPGETISIWIVEGDGARIMFEAETYTASPPELGQEIQQIIDSVQFE